MRQQATVRPHIMRQYVFVNGSDVLKTGVVVRTSTSIHMMMTRSNNRHMRFACGFVHIVRICAYNMDWMSPQPNITWIPCTAPAPSSVVITLVVSFEYIRERALTVFACVARVISLCMSEFTKYGEATYNTAVRQIRRLILYMHMLERDMQARCVYTRSFRPVHSSRSVSQCICVWMCTIICIWYEYVLKYP